MTDSDLTATSTPVDDASASDRAWKRSLVKGAIAYLFSRVCVLAGAGIIASFRSVVETEDGKPLPSNAVNHILDVLTSWDGLWYFAIVRDGYPRHIPENVTYFDNEARAAFFPVYPTIVRWVDVVLPGGDVLAGVFVNFVLGALAVYVVGLLARDIFGGRVAERSMILMALFPGSFVLSFAYSEASLLVVAAACLLMLGRRQWLAAGVLAAIGTATRPNGIALVIACALAAGMAIWQRREWRSLVAPLLAPIGFLGFHLFLWRHTGESRAWFRVQREAWGEGASFGISAIRGTIDAFSHPLASPTDILTAVSTLATIGLCWAAYKKRLPLAAVGYSAIVLALMLMPETVTARPRFLYTAFPLLIALAAWMPDDDTEHGRDLWTLLIASCAVGVVTLTGLYGSLGAIP